MNTKSRIDGLRNVTDAAGYAMTDAMLERVADEVDAITGEMGAAAADASPRVIILTAARCACVALGTTLKRPDAIRVVALVEPGAAPADVLQGGPLRIR